MPRREHLLSPAKPQKPRKKSSRRKLAISALIGLSSVIVSADALANAGNDTGKGIGTDNGWIAIGEGAEASSVITTKEK